MHQFCYQHDYHRSSVHPDGFCQPGCCLFRWWFRPVGFGFTFRYLYVLLDSCCWFERSFQRKPGCFRNHVNHGIHGDGYLHRQHLFCYCHYFRERHPLTTVTASATWT